MVVYLCGAATSAGLMVTVGDPAGELGTSAVAASLPSLAKRVEASRAEIYPPPPADEGPGRLIMEPIVISLGAPRGREALVLNETTRINTDLTSGAVVPFAAFEASHDSNVARETRTERSVGSVSRRSPDVALDASQVRGVVATQMPGLRRCYERASRRQGFGTDERLRLDLRISRGEVRSATVTGASSALLEQCVSGAARSWRFPTGSAQVSLPVRLRPQEG